MPEIVQISCIVKPDRFNPHERIQIVGGWHGGKRWWLPLDLAIAGALNGTYRFYVAVNNISVWVEVEQPIGRHPYLKTVPDGTPLDNLLSLETCPV